MKRIIALSLAIILTVGLTPAVFANIQIPVDSLDVTNVHYIIGENIITGEPIINPTMTVEWENPDQWANDIEVHDPDYYELTVNNVTLNESNVITISEGSTEFTEQSIDLHDELNLKTGSLYELTIVPFHYHTVDLGGGPVLELAPNQPGAEMAYAVTDLNVEFVSDEDSIQVIWDDIGIPDFEYRIVYALGDYTSQTKQDLLNNAEGEILGLTIDSDDVDTYFDQVDQRNKLSYTIDESIYPGQVYSIMVEPITEYYNGNVIVRNRNLPFIKSVSTNVQLSLVEEGDYIRLQWEIPASFRVGQAQDEYALVEATLTEYQDGLGRTLVIFDGDAASIGYYRVQKPIWETEYELKLTYRAVDDVSKPPIEPISNRLTFVPSEYLIQPTKPYVPKVLTEDILDDLRSSMTLTEIQEELRDKYLVLGHNYTGALDSIFDENITFHANSAISAINFVWTAFERIDVDVTSPTYNELITDTNVYYDIWVTDELATLAYATPVLLNERYTSTTDPHVITDSTNDIVGFRQSLSFYYDTSQGALEEVSPDKLYYIKVQAKKITAQGTLVSEPTITSIYFSYEGSSFEPPTIAKPPLKIKDEETTDDGVTLNWRESWYEVISPDVVHPHVLANWQHQIWVDEDTGIMYNEPRDGTEYYAIYEGQGEVQRFKDYAATLAVPPEIIDRRVTLGLDEFGVSDVQYRFHMIPYEYVLDQIETRQNVDPDFSFEEYYNELVENDRDGTVPIGWQDIVPYVDDDDEYSLSYRINNLEANTSYLLIVMPYRELTTGEVLYSHYPTPIIASTAPEDVIVVPNPTVPTLYVTNLTDTEVTVTWKYNTDFEYTLVYNSIENVGEAIEVPIVLPENILDPNYPRDGEYFDVVVDDLFPLTTYYFWIRAIQPSNSTMSVWSNPAVGNTLDTDAPIPPRGVGLAPLSRIEDYGYTDSVSDNFMIIEWIRDSFDVDEEEEEGNVTKSYSYIVEIADNVKFIDPIYIESMGTSDDIAPDNVEILDKNLIKVNDLVPNRHYFVRVKTRVRVEGSEEGQLIVKDSPSYSEPIRVITLSSGSEYDGFEDPALSILPSEDYEIIYDDDDNMLVFRFRDESTDGSGAADNNVDQRLISELIADNVHEYVIDVNGYKNKQVDMRRIAVPYSIIEAFAEHQVDMKILAEDMTLDIPSGAIINTVKDQVEAFGVAPAVIIDITELDVKHTADLIGIEGLLSVATPQSLSIQVRSTRKTDQVGYTDEMMTVGLKTTSRYEVYEKDTMLYVQDATARWKNLESTYDRYLGQMMFDTADVGTYGLYVIDKETAVEQNQNPSHWSESYRMDVYSQIRVDGLNVYNADSYVSEKNTVQAVYGTAMAMPTIDLSDSLSSSEMTTLNRAGLKNDTDQTDGTITREEAIAMFVRAYEIRNDVAVDVVQGTYSTIVNNSQISAEYKTALAKAHNIGMISDLNNIRPKDAMTYGEFFAVWSRALD